MIQKPKKIILTKTFLTMKTENTDFIPFWANEVNEKIEKSFIPVSDTYPNDKFEAWTIEDFEKMKEKNNQIEVDKFVSIW